MAKLDEYIRKCNLLFTNTVDFNEYLKEGFDPSNVKIDYTNSVKLMTFINMFNNLYKSFLKDYKEIDKLDLGEDVSFLGYSHIDGDKGYSRVLRLFIDNPKFHKGDITILEIKDLNGNISAFNTSGGHPFGEGYYRNQVSFDEGILKQYLDLFHKYRLLTDIYNSLRCCHVYSDGLCFMDTNIDTREMNFLCGVERFNLTFGIGYIDNVLNVTACFNLGEKPVLNYGECNFNMDGKPIAPNGRDFKKIINEVCINKEYLRRRTRGDN